MCYTFTDKYSAFNIGKELPMNKIVASAIAGVVCLGVGVGLGLVLKSNNDDSGIVSIEEELDTIVLKEILKPASELVSLKYCYTDADVYEKNKNVSVFGYDATIGTDKTVFTYDGVINAGIDISEVNYIIDNNSRTITIDIPEPEIFSHEINENSFKFFDVKNSVFIETNLEDYTSLVSDLKKKKEDYLLNDGEFMDSVKENSERVIADFLTVSENTKDYKVIYGDVSEENE